MTAPAVIAVTRVPDQWNGGTQRVINDNFLKMKAAVERAILTGGLIGAGVLAGDVTGPAGSNTVGKIRGKNIPLPTVTEHQKFVRYNNTTGAFEYATAGINALLDGANHTDTAAGAVVRGDLITGQGGTPKWTRLGLGGAGAIFGSDGTDAAWTTLTSLMDSNLGNSRGDVIYRGAGGWTALAPGTSGNFLKTQGAGADPVWAAGGGGSTSPLTTKGDIWGYSTVDDRFPVGAAADGTVLTRDAASTFGYKWAAVAGSSNALLDGSNHTDTVAYTVARGSLIVGNSTPKWGGLVIGKAGQNLYCDGTDATWRFDRKLPADKSVGMSSWFSNGTAINNAPRATVSLGGTEADSGETGAGSRLANKQTQAVLSGVAGRGLVTGIWKAEMGLVFAADFKIVTVNTGAGSLMYFCCGFDTTALPGNKGTRNQAKVAWLQGTDTNFRCLLGDGAALNDMDSGILKDAAWHDVLIYTPDNGTTWKFEMDGVQVQSSTSNVPTTTTAMAVACGFNCTGANASNTPEIRGSYLHVWCGGLTQV